MDDSCVRVALRIRQAIPREIIDGCQICTSVTPGQPQVWMGGEHAFTFDHVFDTDAPQENIFTVVESLVDGCLEGYNATILAYGQTGSGKTYTMGTGFDAEHVPGSEIGHTHGIVPRAVHHLFRQITQIRQAAIRNNDSPPEFVVNAQFVELHNEEINDLISSDIKVYRQGPNKNGIKIHEDASGGIYMVGVGTKQVTNTIETLTCLRDGALVRSTASTNMNDSSSRSHAIFTLHIVQRRFVNTSEDDGLPGEPEFETLSAKFHFVDLAGSERLKRTGAVGERAKEGISINCGLLALGNVISALGDKSKKSSHVPYRVSKLTRLLQDSLGGNSRTLMIACISPCDRDFVETLNTLKYANRARNIKNKVTINQDKSTRVISSLRQEIAKLEAELQCYKQGKVLISENGETETDLYQENLMLSAELEKFRIRVKALQETVEKLTAANVTLLAQKEAHHWISEAPDDTSGFTQLIHKYTRDIEELRTKLVESEATCELLKRKQTSTAALLNKSLSPRPYIPMTSRPGTASTDFDSVPVASVEDLLSTARTEVQNEMKRVRKLKKNVRKSEQDGDDAALPDGMDDVERESSIDSSADDIRTESSDAEDNVAEGSMQEEIANINDQINTKQRLIEQLELSNQRAHETREQFEQQISILMTKIKHIEDERDAVLSSFRPNSATTTDKVKQLRDEYESKLAAANRDLNKFKEALKAHNTLIKKQASSEKQVTALRGEVDAMKRLKVKLQNQLRDENTKWREADAKLRKEILQLRKDQRKRDVHVRALESKDRLREQILKRKHEELAALKKQSRGANFSRRVAGKVSSHKRNSPAKAKKKWTELQTAFAKRKADLRSLEVLEEQMLDFIRHRKQVKSQIEGIEIELDSGMLSVEDINNHDEEMDTLKVSFAYFDRKIGEIQRSIFELSSSSPKVEAEIPNISLAMEHLTTEDCEYLMNKMYEYTIEGENEFRQLATKLSVAEDKIEGLNHENVVLHELLSHIYGKYCSKDPNLSPDLSLKILTARSASLRLVPNGQVPLHSPISSTFGSIRTYQDIEGSHGIHFADEGERTPPLMTELSTIPTSPKSSHPTNPLRQLSLLPTIEKSLTSRKARRLTSTTSELMGNLVSQPQGGMISAEPEPDEFVRPAPPESRGPLFRSTSYRGRRVERRDTFTIPEGGAFNLDSLNNVTGGKTTGIRRAYSNASTVGRSSSRPNTAPSQSSINISQNLLDMVEAPIDNFDMDTTFLIANSNGTSSAPGSPGSTRRGVNNVGNDVFQRLTSSTSAFSVEGNLGIIRQTRDKPAQKSPFLLTHVAEGHSKAVLDIYATEDRLFTGAKDTTVKVWDLNVGKEMVTLTGPPTGICCVKYCEERNLLFAASACYVRVYDLRSSNFCINSLSSAGSCYSCDPSMESYFNYSAKEVQLTSLAISYSNNSLYTSFGQSVKLWDLRTFSPLGNIAGKHQASVMCMIAECIDSVTTFVTGSKDHSIKVYTHESSEPTMNISSGPKATLNPPHYDGIEAFALSGSTLFSGSRDSCIKKWKLGPKPELVTAYNNAHGNWVTGLCLPPPNPSLLISVSRDGMMKAWHTETAKCAAQVEAHKGGVNCVTCNSTLIFTGSNIGQLKFWRISNSATSNNACVLPPIKRPLANGRLLSPSTSRRDSQNRNENDLMTMSTGRAYGLSI